MRTSFLITLGQLFLSLVLFALGTLIIGVALFPSLTLILGVWANIDEFNSKNILRLAFAITAGYFLFGFVLMLVVGIFRSLINLRQNEGIYPISSIEVFKWYFLNALFLVVKIVFMDFILLTPFCPLFYRMLGAKVGRNVQINSKNVADLSLLEIGDNAVIGGNATVIAHSFEKDGLHLKKVKIGNGVVIGLNSVIMPGSEINDRAVVAAGAIVPKGTRIAANTVYLGVNK